MPYELGLPPVFTVTRPAVAARRFDWRLGRNYVRLDPYRVAHLLRVA